MTNKQRNEGKISGENSEEKKAPIEKLPVLEMYAVLGLELGKKIFETLEEVHFAVESLARQKARELNQAKKGK